jgi:hypothetical protein
MDLSIFLAKVIGLYTLFMSMVILRKPELQELTGELLKSTALRMVAGAFTLILGLLMVVAHNIWGGEAYVTLITVVAWITLIKGFLYVWLSDEGYGKLVAKLNLKSWITIAGVVNLIVGIYLTYIGFFI